MRGLSKKVEGLEESQTLAFTARVRVLRESGIDVVSLTAGEPDFPTPAHAKEAAVRAIREDFTHYTPLPGIAELLDAIARKFSTENGLQFGRDQILVSSGAKHSIFNALQALCDPGDEVVIISPYWVSYPDMIRLAGGEPRIARTNADAGFRPDMGALRSAITARTKAVILNTPSNPSGVVYTRDELEELAAIVKEADAYVVSDEIYEKVIYDGRKHVSIGSLDAVRDRVVTVNGFSKAHAMTGWRIGYMGGPAHIVAAAAKVQGQVTSNANSVAQKAALAALTGSGDHVAAMMREFTRRRDYVYDALSRIPRVAVLRPEGAMYFFFSVAGYLGRSANGRRMEGSYDMALYLLNEFHVGVVPGAAFGDDCCLRISFSCAMADLSEGIQRIERGLRSLN